MPIIIYLPSCQFCGKEYETGEIIAGVRIGYEEAKDLTLTIPGQYFEGHYDCVVDALGPVETLNAIQAGKMSTRNIAMETGVKRDKDGKLIPVAQPGPKKEG